MKESRFQPDVGPQPELESEKEYHFEEMVEFERFMIPLVEQLKGEIELGKYDTLLSDDAGWRIPTLVLREIIKEKNTGGSNEGIKTYFLAGERQLPENQLFRNRKIEEKIKYLKELDFGGKKLLVVTQFSMTGKGLISIASMLERAGINSFDFAIASIHDEKTERILNKKIRDEYGSTLFIGGTLPDLDNIIINKHEKLSGIKSGLSYSHPEKVGEQEDINKSREDVKLMAERIIEKVWGNE